jgi:hypothetical protein
MSKLAKINSYSKAIKWKLGLIKYPQIISEVRKKGLSYLGEGALYDIFMQITRLEDLKVPGIFIEAGCALGGSAIVIAKSKQTQRKFMIFDVFDMIPPPSGEDGDDVQQRYQEILNGKSNGIGGDTYYGYRQNLFDEVQNNFQDFDLPLSKNNVELIKGLFEDTMIVDEPVAFAHIDGDWYKSVLTCLERIVPNLSKNGVLVIDDYFCWSGCQKAVDEYFNDKRSNFVFKTKERLFIERIDDSNTIS